MPLRRPGFHDDGTLDLVELSDAFRRHAAYGKDQERIGRLVQKARDFSCLTTYRDAGSAQPGLDRKILQAARDIAALDKGLRGMANVIDGLPAKWDASPGK